MADIGTIWDRTLVLIDSQRRSVAMIAVAIFVPTALQNALQPLTADRGAFAVMVRAVILLLSIVSLWGHLGVVAFALDPAAGSGVAMRRASRRLGAAILVLLLLLVALTVACLPMPLLLAAGRVDLQAMAAGGTPVLPPGVTAVAVLYGMVLFCVVLWATARLVLVLPVVLAEGKLLAVPKRSFMLTRGMGGAILGAVLLYWLVELIAFLAAKFAFGTLLAVAFGGDGDGPLQIGAILAAIPVAAVLSAFSVLSAAFVAELYRATRSASGTIVPPQ